MFRGQRHFTDPSGDGSQTYDFVPNAMAGDSLPAVVHKVQGAIYKGFVAPVALFGILGVAISRNQRNNAAPPEDRP